MRSLGMGEVSRELFPYLFYLLCVRIKYTSLMAGRVRYRMTSILLSNAPRKPYNRFCVYGDIGTLPPGIRRL